VASGRAALKFGARERASARQCGVDPGFTLLGNFRGHTSQVAGMIILMAHMGHPQIGKEPDLGYFGRCDADSMVLWHQEALLVYGE